MSISFCPATRDTQKNVVFSRTELACSLFDMEDVRDVGWSSAVECTMDHNAHFKLDPVMDRKPVKGCEYRCDVLILF